MSEIEEALRDALADAVAYLRGEISGEEQLKGILADADAALEACL